MRRETNHNNIIGRRGEDIAAAFLLESGFVILAKNWRYSHLEVDLIATKGQALHFIEVKTRREPVEGDPWDAVTIAKMRRIGDAAKSFLHSKQCLALPFTIEECHFDIVSTILDADGNTHSTELIEDAFVPGII